MFVEEIRNGRECGKKLGMGVSFKFVLLCWNFWLFVHRLWHFSRSFSTFMAKLFLKFASYGAVNTTVLKTLLDALKILNLKQKYFMQKKKLCIAWEN